MSVVYRLRQALGLDAPGTPVNVIRSYLMLGEIADDLREALGIDTAGVARSKDSFGFALEGWKPWTLFDDTPVLVPEGFNTEAEVNGDLLMYPQGDKSAPPCARMPQGGWYFDAIIRQPPIDEARLDPADNCEEFGPLSEGEIEYFCCACERARSAGERAVAANFGGTGFGDIAAVPAMQLRHPKGIRDIEEWYRSLVAPGLHLPRL